MRVEKDYRFTAEDGEASLRDLFGGRSQLLVVYHFMFDPDWDEDCPSYSGVTDGFAGSGPHFEHHDVAFVVVSRAPLDKLVAYKRRMGWNFRWVSSLGSSFNYDFHVTIDPAVAPVEHNYKDQAQLEAANVAWRDWSGEQPGMSAFARDGDDVFHTYSAYSRGFDGCGRWGSGWTLCRWAAMKATGGPIAEPAHRQLDRRSRSPNISAAVSEEMEPEPTVGQPTAEQPGAEQPPAGTKLKSAARIAAFDVVGPLFAYALLRRAGLSAVTALILSGVLPAIGVTTNAIQRRRWT